MTEKAGFPKPADGMPPVRRWENGFISTGREDSSGWKTVEKLFISLQTHTFGAYF
jgi:hypothetical protein